jgi:glycosyltransferase involved in cell wall biosynthesis
MTEKLRVMQITNNLGIGGLERVVVNLCRHLDRDRFEVAACCLNFRGPFADELEKDSIPVHLAPHKTEGTDYAVFWGLKDILKKVKPHIVHTHNTNALFDGFLGSVLAGVPVKIHTDHARRFPDKMRYMIAEGIIGLFLDHVIAVSEETRQNLIKYEHISPKKISVINNGIDGSRYDITIDVQKKKEELGLTGFKHIAGLGVRLTEEKGITYLIKAAPMILKRYPDTAFILAGDGYLKEKLQKEVGIMGLDKNFFFLGPRLDIPEILQVLDVYVLPSEREGLPLVILEAMAAGKAIVATDVGGNSAAIDNGSTGYLVPALNPDALSDKVCELLENPDRRAEFSKASREHFYSAFEVKHMARKYEKVYLETLARKGIRA